ncbi:MAG: TetR/AcrR family transcriptional regulator [Propionivibrio sp.]
MKQAYFQLSPEKRDAILTAACAEFGAHDFDAASLDRVVAAAGISKGGLYEYIASKEELYLYCTERTWSALYEFIRSQAIPTRQPLPDDILERFMTVSRIAIDWYLQNPDLLGLLVRIARLPHAALAEQAQAVFEAHFSEVFAGLDASRLGYPVEQLIDLVKWLLAKTRKDLLLAIEGGGPPETLRKAYLDEWAFFCSVLAGGIYRPPAPA